MRAVLLALGILVTGCSSAASGPSGKVTGVVSQGCADALSGLTDALFGMDSRLDLGLTYAAYGDRLADAKVAYDKVRWSALDVDCIGAVGKPAEDAINEYIIAYNAWKECIDPTGCDTDSIKPSLQAHWSTASRLLADAHDRLP